MTAAAISRAGAHEAPAHPCRAGVEIDPLSPS
jgi:hypothetical protein